MSKFEFLGNGEFQIDHYTLTLKSITALAIAGNGFLKFRGPKGEPLKISSIEQGESSMNLTFDTCSEDMNVNWGIGRPKQEIMNLPVIGTLIEDQRKFFPITMHSDDDMDRPVIVVSVCK